MKTKAALLATLLGLAVQVPANAHGANHHLVYQFGYNTKVAASGNGTGTTTIDIGGVAPDGGVMISGTDNWWNSARPRATNSCELYANGNVSCAQAPYAISPIQLTIFPMLARNYFKGLSNGGNSSWTRTFQIKAAMFPGQSGFAGNAYTWKCTYGFTGKGPIANAGGLILIVGTGTLSQQSGRYLKATSQQRIVYDPAAKLPAIVRDVRTHVPQRSVNSYDVVELKLLNAR
jgi:hypothetical protein